MLSKQPEFHFIPQRSEGPGSIGELVDVLTEILENAENSRWDHASSGDRHIQGKGSALGVDVIDPVPERREVEPGFLPGPPALADGKQQVPDDPFGGGEILRCEQLALSLLRFLVEGVVLTGGIGLVRTELAPGTQGEDGMAPALKASSAAGFPERTAATQVSMLCFSFFSPS